MSTRMVSGENAVRIKLVLSLFNLFISILSHFVKFFVVKAFTYLNEKRKILFTSSPFNAMRIWFNIQK